MLLTIPPAALMTLAAPPRAPEDGGAKAAAAVASLVGEEVAAVVHVDLAGWAARASLRRVLGKPAEEGDAAGPVEAVGALVGALKKAGAKDLFLLLDPADMPGLPVAVVPLTEGADAGTICGVLSGGGAKSPFRWPSCETIRGAVVAGSPAALARVRGSRPVDRPDLAAALGAGGDAPARVAIVPSLTQRRAVEESMPTLPERLGGGPITTLSLGLTWASLAVSSGPDPTLRVVVRAKDADAAKALQKVFRDALDLAAGWGRDDPAAAGLADALGELNPQAQGDRIAFETDLAKTAALVAVPVRRARESARRSQCTNNLKNLGLAFHNYHSAHNTFPAAFSAGKGGKPLLSWRVHILPFLDQKDLYEEFHLDEPWDSQHNRALIPRMPKVYACPGASRAKSAEGETSYLTPRGPATAFPGAGGVKIQDITDGASNTVLVVDAGDGAAVVWTEPADRDVAPGLEAGGLPGHHPGGTNVGFADGSVRFLRKTMSPRALQALTTRDGGEALGPDDF